MTKKNEPATHIRYGLVEATVWKNQGKDRPFYSATLSRSYKAEDGTWKQTQSLSGSELLVAAQALQEAYKAIQELKASDGGEESPDAA